jgi:hypothetical protein
MNPRALCHGYFQQLIGEIEGEKKQHCSTKTHVAI